MKKRTVLLVTSLIVTASLSLGVTFVWLQAENENCYVFMYCDASEALEDTVNIEYNNAGLSVGNNSFLYAADGAAPAEGEYVQKTSARRCFVRSDRYNSDIFGDSLCRSGKLYGL